MSPRQQDTINTIAFHVGQLVLARSDEREFLRRLIILQRDLEKHRQALIPRTIVDDWDDEDLVSPLDNS